ncbi:hypothetical protein ACFVYF_15865 [Streptomyces sp. NPDC058274]|uniref:hypothetical protein n=1 Tax=Streptomyces sp. NPDC058274 TaxID=3346416 RepID=UPI0029CE070B|nr:hypothetical protein [Streptomyces sp.]
MGALRRIRRPTGRRRVLAAVALGAAGVFGTVACEPGDGLSSAAVAYTTDQTGTKELERRGADVQWLSCTANYGDGNKAFTPGKTPSSSAHTVANVDCQGQTKDGREITIKGKVTREIDGKCVRGDLTAEVGGKRWFRLDVLGNCNAASTPTYTPPVTYAPGQPRPTVTVTVTETIWCQGDPTCRPVEGK